MKRKKAIAFALTTALFALALTACGSQGSSGSADIGQSGGDGSEPIHVSIGVTGAVHEQIWAPAIETLKDEGIEV